MKPAVRRLPQTVIALGVVSLLTDLSSEMIYPLLPIFLSSVLGVGTIALGLIEGAAEATAALLKVASGVWTDLSGRRKPLIFAGYSLSGLMRPLIGLATVWPAVLVLRFADRVGKGLRTSPRDALIADVTEAGVRGAAYGFHRAMDHAGAVLGPLVAALLLNAAGLPLRQVFLLSAIPAIAVMAVLFMGVKEPTEVLPTPAGKRGGLTPWSELCPEYRRLLVAVFVFTLGNSTDAFLLLRLSEAGLPVAGIALLWSVHHIIKMAANYYGGQLSDRIGARTMIRTGWLFYAAIYVTFGWFSSVPLLIFVFLAYGIYFGLTEPAERSWVASLVPADLRGTAFGWFHGAVGLAALPASVIFGLIWQHSGVAMAFSTGAMLAMIGVMLLPSGYTAGETKTVAT